MKSSSIALRIWQKVVERELESLLYEVCHGSRQSYCREMNNEVTLHRMILPKWNHAEHPLRSHYSTLIYIEC